MNIERSDGDRLSLAWPRGAASAHPRNLPVETAAACPSGPLRAFLREVFGPEPVERQAQDPWWKRGEECPF